MNNVDRNLVIFKLCKHAHGAPLDPPAAAPSLASRAGKLVSGLSGKQKLLAVLGLGATGVGAGAYALSGNNAPQPAPQAPQPAPSSPNTVGQMDADTMRAIGLAMPSIFGAAAGGVGSLLGGGNPLRGAGVGIGTGLGFTAGGFGGTMLGDAMGVQDPALRSLLALGTAGAGAYAGNRLASGLIGNKKRRRYEDE